MDTNIQEQLPQIFSGLETFGGEYELKGNASPYHMPCMPNVPIPLSSKVCEKLKSMEDLGNITEHTVCWNSGYTQDVRSLPLAGIL